MKKTLKPLFIVTLDVSRFQSPSFAYKLPATGNIFQEWSASASPDARPRVPAPAQLPQTI